MHSDTVEVIYFQGTNLPTDEEEGVPERSAILTDNISGGNATSESGARQLLDEHETLQTKLLTNEQLQRLVLLKQVKVLTLQQQRLERLEGSVRIENEKDIAYEFIGWEGANQN